MAQAERVGAKFSLIWINASVASCGALGSEPCKASNQDRIPGSHAMPIQEQLYLALVIVSFVGFMLSLAAVTVAEHKHEK
jgi:hypothetical protein